VIFAQVFILGCGEDFFADRGWAEFIKLIVESAGRVQRSVLHLVNLVFRKLEVSLIFNLRSDESISSTAAEFDLTVGTALSHMRSQIDASPQVSPSLLRS
jgi:hypothetical protein